MTMYRIYFDENAGDQLGRYDLGIPGSLRDLDRLAGKLVSGMHVTLHDDGDLELEAVLEYDSGRWMALPIWGASPQPDPWVNPTVGAK